MEYNAITREETLTSNVMMKDVPYDVCSRISRSEVRPTHVVVGVSYGGSCNLDLITVKRSFFNVV